MEEQSEKGLLMEQWKIYKDREAQAQKQRRQIEDKLLDLMLIDPHHEGSISYSEAGRKLTITTRMTRKVNGDLLQDIAAEHGISEHLGRLFRWKPEIDAKAWKATAEEITAPLLGAIETKPGRPSFKVEEIKE